MVQRNVELAGRYRLEEPLGRGGMGGAWICGWAVLSLSRSFR